MQEKNRTLKSQLLISIFLLIIVLSILIAGGIYNLSHRLIVSQIGNSRIDVLKQIGERISGVKNMMLYALNTVSASHEIEEYAFKENVVTQVQSVFSQRMESLIQQLDNAFQGSDFQYCIECCFQNGIIWSTKGQKLRTFEEIKNELWYKELQKDSSEVLWIGSSVGQMKNAGSEVAAVKAIMNENREIIGVIVISVRETMFGDTYENILNQENEIFIVDETGKIVSSNKKERLGLRYFNMKELSELLGNKGYSLVSNQQGSCMEERLISAVLDQDSSWTMIEFIQTEELFSEMDKMTIRTVFFVIVSILMAGIWCWYFANRTVRPLKQLEKDIDRVKNGDIFVETEIKGWQEIYGLRDNFNEMMRKIQELMDDIRTNEQEKHELELDFLQAQINPHFLYNTLFSIKCLVDMNENKKATVMISDFIDLLRLVLKKEGEFITLESELECIKKYTEIQKYRYEDRFDVYYEIPENCRKLMIPKLILQPLVENAIFHGIEPKDGNGTIVISAKREEDKFQILVSDDGVGMTKEKQREVLKHQENRNSGWNNIGLYNVNARIRLLYGNSYSLQIESEQEYGTTVIIELSCGEGGKKNENFGRG